MCRVAFLKAQNALGACLRSVVLDNTAGRFESGASVLYQFRGAIFFAALLLMFANAFATLVFTDISSDSMTIGDRLQLQIAIVTDSGGQIQPPDVESAFDPFVVKDWSMQLDQRGATDSLTYTYIVSAYEAEACSIPALSFIELTKEQPETLMTAPIPVRVASVLSGDTVALRDLKEQQIAGKQSLLWLWIILGLAGLAAITWGGRYLWFQSRKPPPAPPPKAPYEEAMEAIAALRAKKYPCQGMIREYIFELSEIFKRYIGRCFTVNALEYTTEEMLAWTQNAPVDKNERERVRWFFRESDPIKFARFMPDHETLSRFEREALAFIEATRPRPLIQERKAGDAARDTAAIQEEKTSCD